MSVNGALLRKFASGDDVGDGTGADDGEVVERRVGSSIGDTIGAALGMAVARADVVGTNVPSSESGTADGSLVDEKKVGVDEDELFAGSVVKSGKNGSLCSPLS